MKTLLVSLVLVSAVCSGCASWKGQKAKPAASPSQTGAVAPASPESTTVTTTTIVTPDTGLTGKVIRYNDAGRFVVIEFRVGHLPVVEQRLFVYRSGLKIGELKVAEWQTDTYVVADLVNGEAQAGDEVRDK